MLAGGVAGVEFWGGRAELTSCAPWFWAERSGLVFGAGWFSGGFPAALIELGNSGGMV